jgi:hypothetical protein
MFYSEEKRSIFIYSLSWIVGHNGFLLPCTIDFDNINNNLEKTKVRHIR